ncbi:MAG: alpha/beta fold hydrolase [Burkholderiales bacterium]
MPELAYLTLTPDVRLHHRIDDWTDPWTNPESIVLIHGFAERTEAWRAWVPLLGRRLRVIRYDQPGFGRSSPVRGISDFSTEGFVAAAAAVIEQLAGGRAHVVGAKSGGLIAIEVARRRPELVLTLTLASTPLEAPKPDQWLAHMEAHGLRSWAKETMAPRLGSAMPPAGGRWRVNLMGRTSIETARAYMRWVSNLDIAATLHEVRCPALVLTTSAPRRAYSRSDADVYRERLPHAQLVALPGDGYHVAASYPEACVNALTGFLAQQKVSGANGAAAIPLRQ